MALSRRQTGVLQGAIGGGAAFAPTANPFAIGAGIIGGAALGAFEDTGLTPEEREFNRLQLIQGRQAAQIGGLNIRQARRLEEETAAGQAIKRRTGRQLGRLFEALPR